MKSDFLNQLKEMDNYTFTENGAIAYGSTGNKVLDAFGMLASMTNWPDDEILNTFYNAFNEDKELAMRLLFYVRDIRGGQGMRRVFRVIARNLALTNPDLIINNFDNFLFFGRGDDLLCLFDTPIEHDVIEYLVRVLNEDLAAVYNQGTCSLLAKWMPSENASSSISKYLAKKIRHAMGLTSKDYRILLSTLRSKINIVETLMSENKWDEIDFEKLPSRAAMIYSDAFTKHVEEEYINYLKGVATGDSKINAGALFPVDIIKKVTDSFRPSMKDRILYNCMWEALPNYFEDKEETGICVVDTSGSMWGTPIQVALSLGLYCADKCKGPFKNHFITFSANPKLQEIKGDNIFEKVRGMESSNWMMNTNMEAVFDLILQTAIANNTPQEDLPSKLYIISDMQFDNAISQGYGKSGNMTFMQTMEQKYKNAGYTIPAIVYWNVSASHCGMFHQKFNETDCCMVSGYSPSLFKSVIEGTEFVEEVNMETGETVIKQKLDPITVMTKTLMNERYDRVFVA